MTGYITRQELKRITSNPNGRSLSDSQRNYSCDLSLEGDYAPGLAMAFVSERESLKNDRVEELVDSLDKFKL